MRDHTLHICTRRLDTNLRKVEHYTNAQREIVFDNIKKEITWTTQKVESFDSIRKTILHNSNYSPEVISTALMLTVYETPANCERCFS